MSFKFLLSSMLAIVAYAQVWSENPATWRPRERWRGFNIEGKAAKGSFSGEWREADLRMMHEFGFNFARVMLDYRYWCKDSDWTRPDPVKLQSVDEMIGWGKKYGIHIQLCFATAPGMQLKPRSKRPLFSDLTAQKAMETYWAYLARRYRSISNDELSFNLFNEPDSAGTEETYLPLVKKLVSAIHAEDPKRFILIDGLEWARKPLLGALGLPVGQSHHAYSPMSVSHYRASWIKESFADPVPMWPPSPAMSPLCGSRKPQKQSPIVILDVPKSVLTLNTGLFNREVELVVEADGKTLFSHYYRPSQEGSEWTNLIARAGGGGKEWAAELKERVRIDVPECKRLSIGLARGDWMKITSLELSAFGKTAVLPFFQEWDFGRRRDLRFVGFGKESPFVTADGIAYTGDTYLDEKTSMYWKPVLDAGQFVMVGEVGCCNKTPHDVALRWLENNLRRWKERGIGWAMWNFRGSMGILDSNRKDVEYENYQGLKLDRKMLELLQKY